MARNTIWNLVGQVLPMLVGVAALPPLVKGLGVDRFGVLSLAWIIVGYFSLFDFGAGRALTKIVADKVGNEEQHNLPATVWTSLFLMAGFGTIGAAVALMCCSPLVRALKIPFDLQQESLIVFRLLAVSIPIVTVSSGLRGVLEAKQKFSVLTLIRVPSSAFSFLGPLLVLPFSKSLVPMVLVLMLGRVAALGAHFFACVREMPSLRRHCVLDRSTIGEVINFGGWMTVSNIVGPIMTYLDRFFIGAMLSVSAVSYYTAPFDMATRLLLIPASLTGVLFPALSMSLARGAERTAILLARSEKYLYCALFPLVLVLVAFSPEGLRLWLGQSFAATGAGVLRWIVAGVFVNSLAQIPFSLIQSAGKPEITARLHLVELPIYLGAVWVLTSRFGIEGTAIAWTGRTILDAVLLFSMAYRVWPRGTGVMFKLGTAIAAGLFALYLSTLGSLFVRAASVMLLLSGLGVSVWFFGSTVMERNMLMTALNLRGQEKKHQIPN